MTSFLVRVHQKNREIFFLEITETLKVKRATSFFLRNKRIFHNQAYYANMRISHFLVKIMMNQESDHLLKSHQNRNTRHLD